MDFQVTVSGEHQSFETFGGALDCIRAAIAQWNNFYDGSSLEIFLNKVPGQTPALGVEINDEVAHVRDVFGGIPVDPDGKPIMTEEEYVAAQSTITIEQMDAISAKLKEWLDAQRLKNQGK